MNFNLYDQVNKIYLFITFYTLIIFSPILFLLHKVEALFLKISKLEQANTDLILRNKELESLMIEQKAFIVQNSNLEILNKPIISSMSDDYKIFLIKVTLLIILCIIIFGISFYWFYFLKYGLLSIYTKGVTGLNAYVVSLFYSNNLKSFKYTDRLNNVFTIKLNDDGNGNGVVDILIKPFNSSTTCSLEEFLARNPDLFDSALSEANSSLMSGICGVCSQTLAAGSEVTAQAAISLATSETATDVATSAIDLIF